MSRRRIIGMEGNYLNKKSRKNQEIFFLSYSDSASFSKHFDIKNINFG
jgi:hypothetical protein